MKRYQELTAAVAVVIGSMDAVMAAERLSPAWYKLLRVKVYLDKQAAHVMEGRTEDGAEVTAQQWEEAQEVFFVAEHPAVVQSATVGEMIAGDDTGEFSRVLCHIQRGEVCMIGGGAAPLVCVWMDCTGDGNDITTPADAFSVARGEMDRAEVVS